MDFARRPTNQQPLTVSTHPSTTPGAPSGVTSQLQAQPQTITSNQQAQAQKRAQYKEGPKFGLKSMVSMDDMPELFASFDSK